MKKLIPFIAIGFCLGFLGTFFWQNRQTQAQIAVLEDRLSVVRAENAQLTETLAPRNPAQIAVSDDVRQTLERQVSEIHQLSFKKPIDYRTMKVTEFHGYLTNKLYEAYSQQELLNYSRAMALMGLVPEGTDIGKVIADLYGEQVAAFYDQHAGELYTFSDFSFSENIDRMMLAHEMTHALQDQNFTLRDFPIEIKTNDDLAIATAALVEGDATLLMTLWYMQTLTESFDWRSLFKDLGAMFLQNTEKLAAAPAYFRETLLFPYQQGNEFAMALYTSGGYSAINEAFKKPPVSTEQILHPHKYAPRREDPVEVELPELKLEGWKRICENVLGELGIRILLKEQLTPYESNRAAAGWGGDKYHVYEDRKGELMLLWQTAWDSEADASEFFEAFDATARKRVGFTTHKHAADADGWMRYGNEKLHVAIRKKGTNVSVVLGQQQDIARLLERWKVGSVEESTNP